MKKVWKKNNGEKENEWIIKMRNCDREEVMAKDRIDRYLLMTVWTYEWAKLLMQTKSLLLGCTLKYK